MNKKFHERMTGHVKESFSDLVDMGYIYATLDMQEASVEKGNSSNQNWKKRKFRDNKPWKGKEKKKSNQGNTAENVTCYNCLEKGHYSNSCKKPKRNQFIQAKPGNVIIVRNWDTKLKTAQS